MIKYATNATDDISNLWYARDEVGLLAIVLPFVVLIELKLKGGAIYNVKSLPSGIMAHVAAAQFGDCEGVDPT